MRSLISPSIFVVFLVSLGYLLIWQARPVHFIQVSGNCTNSFLCPGLIDGQDQLYNIVGLSILSFWTFFWNLLLIILLQSSRYIEKSATFLFQQTLMGSLLMYSFVIWVTIEFSLPTQSAYSDFSNALNLKFLLSLSLLQPVFSCLYFGFRYYLTFCEEGAMRIAFSCKFLNMTVLVSLCILLSFQGVGYEAVGIIVTCAVLFGSYVILCLIYRRRHLIQDNKIGQITTRNYFILTIVSAALFFALEGFFTDLLRGNDVILSTYNTSIICAYLFCPLLNALVTLFWDQKLRRTFFDIFPFPNVLLLCRDGEKEKQPLLNNHQPRGHYGNDPHGQRADLDDVRIAPHGQRADSDDVRFAPHGQRPDVPPSTHEHWPF